MNTTGTASHFKNTAASNASTSNATFGQLFRIEKSLNFSAINGSLLTINQPTTTISPYSTHRFVTNALTFSLVAYQPINGSDAISKPAAGAGIPLNP